MDVNYRKLKLNPGKPEFILFGSNRWRGKFKASFPIDFLGSPLRPADLVKNYGLTLTSPCLNMFRVSAKVALCNQLDYYKSPFKNLPKFNLHQLQFIRSSAATIVLK